MAWAVVERRTTATRGVAPAAGQVRTSVSLLRSAVETERRVLGPESGQTLRGRGQLADLLAHRGDLGTAESIWRDVLETRQRIQGTENPATILAAG